MRGSIFGFVWSHIIILHLAKARCFLEGAQYSIRQIIHDDAAQVIQKSLNNHNARIKTPWIQAPEP